MSRPELEVGKCYPGADRDLIGRCRIHMRALFALWRWRNKDQLPNRDCWRAEGLSRSRAELDRRGPD